MTVKVLRYAAFTEHGKGGNPAGVVLDAAGLSAEQMRTIAADVGYSETAFLTFSGTSGAYRARYFSPVAEVAFCGHATVASAVALAERDGPGEVLLLTAAGSVYVSTSGVETGLAATLTSVATRTRPATNEQLKAALLALRWEPDDLDLNYPPHVAYAGNNHLMLAAATRERLADLDYDYPMLRTLMDEQGWTTLHLFWAQTPTLFHARDPFPPGGVVEDPATGAAAAAFGGYLHALHLVPVPGQVTVLQGQDMGAPSRLLIDLDAGSTAVRVTGTAVQLPAEHPDRTGDGRPAATASPS